MKVLKFKTNIENENMVAEIAQVLDNEEQISKWNVDTESPENLLSVSGEEITPDIVTKAVREKGFEAEMVRVIAVGGNDL